MTRPGRKTGRERFLAVALLLTLAVFSARLAQLQLFQHGQWKGMAEGQTLVTKYQKPSRGEITDRNGVTMAVSLPMTYAVGYRARYAMNFNTLAGTLSTLLQKPKRDLREKLESQGFVYLARRVDWQVKQKLEAMGLGCFQFDEEPRRSYPSAAMGAAVVGFSNVDGQGQEGIEAAMNDELSGEGYQELCRVDALRKTTSSISPVPDEYRGATVTLSIDMQYQTIVEEKLRDGLKDKKFERACAIMVDPRTGDILALATNPSFDPNRPGDSRPEHRRCWPVTDVVEPGSTMKVVAIAKALESGRLKRSSKVFCENGNWPVKGAVIHDSHPHGMLTLDEIIAKSSNIGTAKVSAYFPPAEIYDKLRAFGFGNKTMVELAGEQAGYVPPPATWSGPTQATLAFGQGISCTPLQMTMAYAAIANGGLLMKPRLVKSVDFPSGVHNDYDAEVIRRVIPAGVAADLGEMLEGVLENGTATQVKIDGLRIAGKTGTAEKINPDRGGYYADRYIASFIGFFPVENPHYVLMVMIDDPRGEYYGGSVAGPVFKAIVEEMRLFEPRTPPLPNNVPAPGGRPAEMVVNLGTIQDQSNARLNTRTAAYLPAASAAAVEYRIEDGTDSSLVAVPALEGWPLRLAIQELSRRNLGFRMFGSRTVITQFPPAGTLVPSGSTCELHGITD